MRSMDLTPSEMRGPDYMGAVCPFRAMTRVPSAMALIYQFGDVGHDLFRRLLDRRAPRQARIQA